MPDRFSNLPHYLPPPRGRTDGEQGSEPDSPRDRESLRRRGRRVPVRTSKMLGLFVVLVLVAVLGGTIAARLTMIERPSAPGTIQPERVAFESPRTHSGTDSVRAARVLGIREHLRPDARPPRSRPSRTRPGDSRRVKVVPPPTAPVSASTTRPVERDQKRHRPKPQDRSDRRPSPEPVPAPPGTPLFDCYSGEKVDHFMTTDRASAAQVESSKAKYDCSIVGYVYAYPAPHTKPIEVDAGSAYVFSEKDSQTKPSCDKVALYRHETGHDYWYTTDESDQGFVGYMRP